jgi:hypothetical protein
MHEAVWLVAACSPILNVTADTQKCFERNPRSLSQRDQLDATWLRDLFNYLESSR